MKYPIAAAITLLHAAPVLSQTLSNSILSKVRARMNENSDQSWEMGTRAQTLLELDHSSVTVFSPSYLTGTPPSASSLEPVISIARPAVNSMTNDQFIETGSSGDPPSIGVAVLLGNRTNAPGADWERATTRQLNALLHQTPRSPAGAISHRREYVQLWNDFIYMVPPYLALQGAYTGDLSLIRRAYTQIKLYRDVLYDDDVQLWRHIAMQPSAADSPPGQGNGSNKWQDLKHWATGNGWAAGGMLRVLGTIINAPFANQFTKEVDDLKEWIFEIHAGMTSHLPASGIFPNYITTEGSFDDAAGTALFAATVYRAVTLYNPSRYKAIIAAAERARLSIYENNGATHFDSNGWLRPVVNPDLFHQAGVESPEGQAFVLQMDNNWKEWRSSTSVGSGHRKTAAKAIQCAVRKRSFSTL